MSFLIFQTRSFGGCPIREGFINRKIRGGWREESRSDRGAGTTAFVPE